MEPLQSPDRHPATKAARGHRTLAIPLRSTHPLIWVVCAQTASFEPGIVGDYIEYLETMGDEVITAIALETSENPLHLHKP